MLIAFEGLPGAGKTTQSRRLAEQLARDGTPAVYLPDNLTRYSDALGDTLFRLFASSGDPFSRHRNVITDTYLAAAIRTNTLALHITPALSAHRTLIEDRGLYTMYSYSLATLLQSHRTDPDDAINWLRAVGELAGRAADLTLWLRLPVQHALERAARREGHAYNAEQQGFLHHVDDAYAELARRDPALLALDTAGLSTTETHQLVLRTLHDHQAATQSPGEGPSGAFPVSRAPAPH